MAAEQLTTLTYAVRGRVLGKYLGQLGLVLALLTLVPLAVAISMGDMPIARRCGEVIVLLAAVCLPLARLRTAQHLQANEALAITALAFVLTSLVMAWPFMAAGMSLIDAWFEAVSGVTTTGLSTLAEIESRSPAFLFARAWMQWYGGLGIATLWVALLLNHQHTLRRLIETTGAENIVTTAQRHARRILTIYAVLTLAGIGMLILLRVEPFSAVTHVLSAVSTGGFSIHDDSLAGFGAARYALFAVALSGAVSLPVYYALYQRRWRAALADAEPWSLLSACVLVTCLLWLFLGTNGALDPHAAFGQALSMAVSAQTTTGFSTLDVAGLDPASKLTLIGAMFVGGSAGSTAGGIKLLHLLVLLRLLQFVVRRAAMPAHAVAEIRLGGQRLEADDIQRALLIIVLFGAGIVVSWLPFVAAGYAPQDALFEIVSATATVGLSTGITRAELELPLKLVLMADMLLGRVEFVALLVVLWPGTWFGKRDSAL